MKALCLFLACTAAVCATGADGEPRPRPGPRARRVRGATSGVASYAATGVGPAVPCQHDALLRHSSGAVLRQGVVQAVFWGTTWSSHPGDYITGLDTFLHGYGFSDYARVANEYAGPNGPINGNVTYRGHVIVDSPPTWASTNIDVVSNAALAQVCKLPTIDAAGNGIYVVVSDRPRPPKADYCGFHFFGRCRGVRVLYAFVWAGSMQDDAGCAMANNPALPQSAGLASVADTVAHELSEIRTDPEISAWQDSCGDEMADKCDFLYPVPYVTLANGSKWKLQALWSNAAYATGRGVANDRGQRACVIRRFLPK